VGIGKSNWADSQDKSSKAYLYAVKDNGLGFVVVLRSAGDIIRFDPRRLKERSGQ
jgi:hypothetical protein